MSLALEKLGHIMFKIQSLWLKGRRSKDGSRKSILIDVTGLRICLHHALPGDLVWIPGRREQGTVGDEIASQSYTCKVETSSGMFRTNRRNTCV